MNELEANGTAAALESASQLASAGVSVIPIRNDGSKAPAIGSWARFQKNIATMTELPDMFSAGRGLAVICGVVSGGLEVIDVDDADTFGRFANDMELVSPGLLERLPQIQTPRPGRHIYYRCEQIEGNQKLARVVVQNEDGRSIPKVTIETRGEGGYVLAPGCPGTCHETGRTYEHVGGPSIADVPTITAEERSTLLAVARSFNSWIDDADVQGQAEKVSSGTFRIGTSPGDDYSRRATWTEILEPYGWVKSHASGDKVFWRRPGKSRGWSATTGIKSAGGTELFCCFSDNAHPFRGATGSRPCTSYSRFAAYAVLNHDSDYRAAARALADLGYGSRKGRQPATQPEPVPANETKVPANTLDPATEAEQFLKEATIDGASRLRFWKGSFFWWSRGRFVEMTKDQVRGQVIRFLNRGAFGVTTFIVGNLLDQLKAQSAVPWGKEPPCWLDKPGLWPASEVIVAKNGIFHLPSVAGGQEPLQTELTPKLFTQTALNFDLRFDSPEPKSFLTFLSQLWSGDPQSIDCLQEWFGYLLSADTSQQKILLIIGPRRGGKGTLGKVIKEMVGRQNMIAPSLSTLATHFGLASLVGKSVAIVGDARISSRSDKAIAVENMLSISGEDTLTIPRKFHDDITVRLPTRLVLFSNELPKLADASGALAGRMIILRLTNTFFGREDTHLDTKLLAELPSILLWAIEGWRRLNERGRFLQPDSGREIADDMMDSSSDITPFVEECCEIGADHRVEVDELYEAFKGWCARQGKKYTPEKKDLGIQLRAKFPKVAKRRRREGGQRTYFYHGIRISLFSLR